MKTTLDLADLPLPDRRPAVVSIGVFDGVHLGHGAILAANLRRARELSADATVVTFHQHPKQILLGRAPRTLTTLEHRLEHFARAGVDHALALDFDEGLRCMEARRFVDEILVDKLAATSFVLGFDSKFGRDREGGPELLESLGFDVEVVPEVIVDRRPVSSTAIREAVELGDLDGAARMLGRSVSVFGEVVHGDARGREIGFPTANLDLHHELHPPTGVYACRVHRSQTTGAGLPAVTNIGHRPTVDGKQSGPPGVEVHLLDFDGDLYGEHLEVDFLQRLRGERRFPDLAALSAQIAADVQAARATLQPS
ncbi:MAG: riboflavin kinase/FMN adenylyltransferase [Chlamydiales bacterium]